MDGATCGEVVPPQGHPEEDMLNLKNYWTCVIPIGTVDITDEEVTSVEEEATS